MSVPSAAGILMRHLLLPEGQVQKKQIPLVNRRIRGKVRLFQMIRLQKALLFPNTAVNPAWN